MVVGNHDLNFRDRLAKVGGFQGLYGNINISIFNEDRFIPSPSYRELAYLLVAIPEFINRIVKRQQRIQTKRLDMPIFSFCGLG